MQPISKNNPSLHKGPASSAEFNRMQNDIHYDLTALFDVANKHNLEIKDNMDILIRENFFMQNKIKEMEDLLKQIKTNLLYKEQGLQRQHLIQSFYSVENIVQSPSANGGLIDTLYGVATIRDSDRVVKTSYRSDDQQVILPSSLEFSLMESNNTRAINSSTGMRDYYLVADSGISKAFDRSNNTFWVHTSSFPEESNISEVYGLLHVKLPLNILNNIFTNVLTLHPYPEYSLTIADIQYKGYGDTWYRLPNYPTEKDAQNNDKPVPIKDASKLMFAFPKTEVTEIQIFFSQPYWFSNEGERDFVYGFQDIGVEYRSYNISVAEFVTKFSIEGTKKRLYTIEEPTTVAAVGTEQDIESLVEHKLYYSESLTSEFEFGNEILAPIQKVYVKTTIRSDGDTVPVIQDIKIDYTYKDLDDI
jgi:hypothetical protein